jgi:hypothetical protein
MSESNASGGLYVLAEVFKQWRRTMKTRRAGMKTRIWIVWFSLIVIVCFIGTAYADMGVSVTPWQQAGQTELTEAKKAEVKAKMATLQIPFIPNHGQMDEHVACYARNVGERESTVRRFLNNSFDNFGGVFYTDCILNRM